MRPKKAEDPLYSCAYCLYFVQHYIRYPVPGGFAPCEYGHCIAGPAKRTRPGFTCGDFLSRKCFYGKDDV